MPRRCAATRLQPHRSGLADVFERHPLPISNLRQVFPVLADVVLVLGELGFELLLQCVTFFACLRQILEGGEGEVETIQAVEHRHIKRRGGGSLFLEAMNMQTGVIRALIGEAVDQGRIAVMGKDDGFVGGEERIELGIAETVWMLGG